MNSLFEKLVKNQIVIGLVQKMQPVEVALVIHKQLGLETNDAAKLAHELFSTLGKNSSYGQPKLKVKEDYVNFFPSFNIQAKDFPPPNRERPEDWPYDAMNRAAMDPHSKAQKRPLMTGMEKSFTDKNKPGGDATGIYGLNPISKHNNLSISSNSWSKEGVPGLSKSPSNKEFDVPDNHGNAGIGSTPPTFMPGSSQGRQVVFRLRRK